MCLSFVVLGLLFVACCVVCCSWFVVRGVLAVVLLFVVCWALCAVGCLLTAECCLLCAV